MGSHRRSRSRSPERSSHRSRHRSGEGEGKEERREGNGSPPDGIAPIDAEDYFLKSTEFRAWLHEEKDRRLDSLTGEDARKYFKKFTRRWNAGDLAAQYYTGVPSRVAATAHKWNFKASERELDDASSIGKQTTAAHSSSTTAPTKRTMGPTMGPTMPPTGTSLADLQFSRAEAESERNHSRANSKAEYSKRNREDRQEEKDDRSTGRERMLEKRREGNASNRDFADKDQGDAVDDSTLMGSGGSWREAVNARDRVGQKPSRRMQQMEEKKAVVSDNLKQYRTKEDDTMAMFRQLASKYN